MEYVDEHPEYWEEYNNLQHVKHAMLRRYLGGWFPILSKWHGRVVYVDCHAGRGAHSQGEKGSPLIALEVLLGHSFLERIVAHTEVVFTFIERDCTNAAALEGHLAEYTLPRNVRSGVVCQDFEQAISGLVDDLIKRKLQMAPAFVFVDPYGFKLSMGLLSRLKSFERCELFVNFMWRYIDMAMHHDAQEQNMDALFGSPEWRRIREIEDPAQRCDSAIRLFQQGLGARYITWTKMLGENQAVKYILLHATNHRRGRELMKEAIWALCPTGDFVARVADNPDQEFLIEPEPDLTPLEEWLSRKYPGHEIRYKEIEDELIRTIFLPKHLNSVLRRLRKDGRITLSGYEGRLAFDKNPTITYNPPPTRDNDRGR
jgi:three-Cys-motif partner protein